MTSFCGFLAGDILEAAQRAVDHVDVRFLGEQRGDDGDRLLAAADEQRVDGGFPDQRIRVGDEIPQDRDGEHARAADGGDGGEQLVAAAEGELAGGDGRLVAELAGERDLILRLADAGPSAGRQRGGVVEEGFEKPDGGEALRLEHAAGAGGLVVVAREQVAAGRRGVGRRRKSGPSCRVSADFPAHAFQRASDAKVFRGLGGSPRIVGEIAAGEFLEQFERAEADGERRVIEQGDQFGTRRGFGFEDRLADDRAALGVGELRQDFRQRGDIERAVAETLVGVVPGNRRKAEKLKRGNEDHELPKNACM